MGLRFDAVVIGGGISGCAAAALLSRHGYKTLLLEKSPLIGGRAAQHQYRGFAMDVGGHVILDLDTSPLAHVLKESGARVELLSVDPPWKFYDWKVKTFVAPDDYWRSRLSVDELWAVNRVYEKIRGMSPEEIAGYEDISAKGWIEQNTDKPQAIMEVAVISGGREAVPFISAASFLRTWNLQLNAKTRVCYPRGGIQKLSEAFVDAMKRNEGELITGCTVTEIVVKDGRVRGLRAKYAPNQSSYSHDVFVESPVVVSAIPFAALPTVLPSDATPEELGRDLQRWKTPAVKSIGLVFAAKRAYLEPNWGWAQIPAPKGSAIQTARTLFAPSVISPDVAPKGYHYFFYDLYTVDDKVVRNRERILDQFEGEVAEIWPRLKKNALWIHHTYAAHRQAPVGVGQTGRYKPDVEVSGIQGLFLCGEYARGSVPGVGLESGSGGIGPAIGAAKNCVDAIRAVGPSATG
jgi:phytoene dehydrogenase-like protein